MNQDIGQRNDEENQLSWQMPSIHDPVPVRNTGHSLCLCMGPAHPDIPPTLPFPGIRFRALMDYRLYHLEGTRPTMTPQDRKSMSSKKKSLYHSMRNHEKFDGSELVYAMRFLAIFAHNCDQELIHEGMALELFSKTLKGEAQHEFMRNHQHNRSVAPGLKQWPGACN